MTTEATTRTMLRQGATPRLRRAHQDMLTLTEAVCQLNVSPRLLKVWVREGYVSALERPLSRHLRFPVDEIVRVRQALRTAGLGGPTCSTNATG